jgi:hypothetical protein
VLIGSIVYAQSYAVEIPVIRNGVMATDTFDDGTVVTFGLSLDYAEQEKDQMDTLQDDDLDAGWEVTQEWGLWTYHQSPNIGQVVKEIIDHDDWASGNSLALFLMCQDQGPSDYENAIDGVSETDGVDVMGWPCGDSFPSGFLIVQDV